VLGGTFIGHAVLHSFVESVGHETVPILGNRSHIAERSICSIPGGPVCVGGGHVGVGVVRVGARGARGHMGKLSDGGCLDGRGVRVHVHAGGNLDVAVGVRVADVGRVRVSTVGRVEARARGMEVLAPVGLGE
jgi:hypothetical protein